MLLNYGVGEVSWKSLGLQGIQPVIPKGNHSWIVIGRIDAEAEAPNLLPPDEKSWLIWKDPDVGKDRRREEKGMTEDKMVGWHHWLDGHELSKLRELVMEREAWPAAAHGATKSQTWLSNWTELNWTELGNMEWKSWGITPHLSGLLNSIYMTISTAGGWGKEISLTAGGMYLRPLYNTAVQCFPKPKHWIQQSCVQCCQLLWNFIPNSNKDAIMHSSTIHNS